MFRQRQDRSLEQIYNQFMQERTRVLPTRFPGWYRGLVVETNDPLGFRRVRIKVPELYNNSVKTEDVFWCVPAEWMGGRGAGSFTHPMIGDVVYVSFEKQHPYGPIWTSAADATRRRSYSLWSIYSPSPAPISEDGEAETPPTDFLEDYLPQDNRPMSTGMQDRYGNYLVMSSVGFFPQTHDVDPAPVGTDALAERDFESSKNPPKANDPDVKFFVRGTKYGHYSLMADQGYQWKEEFDGDFDSDISFEEDRVKYLIKSFSEDQPKDHDQRRLEYRTRLGHKFEARDVGWEKTRAGEYSDVRKIADSKGKDERWIKIFTKGGHGLQFIDTGFDPEFDQRYKRLNKSDRGGEINGENEIGTDQGVDGRMIRMITRHGGQFVIDDRGSDPKTAGTSREPHANGIMARTNKGHTVQMVDQPELDHVMIASADNQCLEFNDKFKYALMTTQQSDELQTKIEGDATREAPRYILKTGMSNDPESNTHHLKLDKLNDYIRLKTPDGAGIEMRGDLAPCGQWTETRDSENRAVWMSKTDNFMLIRSKLGQKFILLDDNDDVILIRNERGKIQIRAKDKIEIKCDEGNICLEAPRGQIGLTAQTIEMKTGGATHKIDSAGMGTSGTIQGAALRGFHGELMAGGGGGGNAAKPGSPCTVDNKEITRRKPEDFDKERGCDEFKQQKGPVPPSIMNPPPGGGGSGNKTPLPPSDPRAAPPPPSPNIPPQSVEDPPPPVIEPDPIESVNSGGGGVLWYGVSNKFRAEIESVGLTLESLSNCLNIPGDTEATQIPLSRTLAYARDPQALKSQRRYGDVQFILRIGNVDDPDLLGSPDDDDNVVYYRGNLSFDDNMEIFEIGTTLIPTPPEFPNV